MMVVLEITIMKSGCLSEGGGNEEADIMLVISYSSHVVPKIPWNP